MKEEIFEKRFMWKHMTYGNYEREFDTEVSSSR